MGHQYLITMILVLSIPLVIAYGISSPYSNSNPLQLQPGESRDAAFTLVSDSSEEERVQVSLTEGSNIAQIVSGNEYTIAPGSYDTKVTVRVSIPQETTPGEVYTVRFLVRSITVSGEGTVQLGVGYHIDFPVKVEARKIMKEDQEVPPVEQPAPEDENALLYGVILAILLLILLIIVIWFLKRKMKKNENFA